MDLDQLTARILKQAEWHLQGEMVAIHQEHPLSRKPVDASGRVTVEIIESTSPDGIFHNWRVCVIFDCMPGRKVTAAEVTVPRLTRAHNIEVALEPDLNHFAARVMDGLYAD